MWRLKCHQRMLGDSVVIIYDPCCAGGKCKNEYKQKCGNDCKDPCRTQGRCKNECKEKMWWQL